jgi:hypothetical protein
MLTIDKVPDFTIDSLPDFFKPEMFINNFITGTYFQNKAKLSFWDKLVHVFSSDNFRDTVLYSFWLVFTVSFKPHLHDTIDCLMTKVREINKVQNIKFIQSRFKEELSLYFEFSIAFIIHVAMFDIFKQDYSKVTTPRFILNCYHIVLFERRGMLVSDYYIQSQLEAIFSSAAFIYLNQEARIQKKIMHAQRYSVFDQRMNKQSNTSQSQLQNSMVFPEFNALKTQFKKLNQLPSRHVFDRLRYYIIDFNEDRAAKLAKTDQRELFKESTTENVSANPHSPTPGSPLKKQAYFLPSELDPKLRRKVRAEDAGLTKVKPNVFRLSFACNKVSPAIEKDLAMSLKVNLKPNLKKTMQMTLIEDKKKSEAFLESMKKEMKKKKLSTSHSVLPSKGVLYGSLQGTKSQQHQLKSKEKARITKESITENRSLKVDEFIKGYEDFIDMNTQMSQAKIQNLRPPSATMKLLKRHT